MIGQSPETKRHCDWLRHQASGMRMWLDSMPQVTHTFSFCLANSWTFYCIWEPSWTNCHSHVKFTVWSTGSASAYLFEELQQMALSWPCISCREAAEGAQCAQLCNWIFHKCLEQAKQRYQLRCISLMLHPILPLQFSYRLQLSAELIYPNLT